MPHQISLIGKGASPEKMAESATIPKTSSLLLATVLEFMWLSLPNLPDLSKSLRDVVWCLRYYVRNGSYAERQLAVATVVKLPVGFQSVRLLVAASDNGGKRTLQTSLTNGS